MTDNDIISQRSVLLAIRDREIRIFQNIGQFLALDGKIRPIESYIQNGLGIAPELLTTGSDQYYFNNVIDKYFARVHDSLLFLWQTLIEDPFLVGVVDMLINNQS